jgi:hypothetical protein
VLHKRYACHLSALSQVEIAGAIAAASAGFMDATEETYNPWSIVNLVFRHLADEGLHPVLGEAGDPGAPAAALLQALGIAPSTETSMKDARRVSDELAQLRAAFEDEHP